MSNEYKQQYRKNIKLIGLINKRPSHYKYYQHCRPSDYQAKSNATYKLICKVQRLLKDYNYDPPHVIDDIPEDVFMRAVEIFLEAILADPSSAITIDDDEDDED